MASPATSCRPIGAALLVRGQPGPWAHAAASTSPFRAGTPAPAFSGRCVCHGPTSLVQQRRNRRRCVAGAAQATLATPTPTRVPVKRMPYSPDGAERFGFRGNNVNYVVDGPTDGPAVVLVHGFGASSYHWRHQVPALAAAGYRVYAPDLLGFGLSDKPLVDYSGALWRDQLTSFVEEVVRRPATLAGNSLGGFACLYAASARPDLTASLVLLNSAGRFAPTSADAESTLRAAESTSSSTSSMTSSMTSSSPASTLAALAELGKRAVVHAAFLLTKQPLRIQQVLRQVYVDGSNVDAELVESIRAPAEDPTAAAVFYRVISAGNKTTVTVDELVAKLTVPLLLLWGDADPWIKPERADLIKGLYAGPRVEHARTAAGHCPHDELPEVVNPLLTAWLASL